MTHNELILAAAAALFTAFLLGWLAGWLTLRDGPAPPQTAPSPDALRRIQSAEAEVAQAQNDLREAQIEIEELRDYIDRRLTKRDGG